MLRSVLLSTTVYKAAMRSAQAKDSSITYRTLQSDRSQVLIYNPETRDGIFVRKLNACTYLTSGYYEAWPQVGTNTTLAGNIAALNEQGWPAIEGI